MAVLGAFMFHKHILFSAALYLGSLKQDCIKKRFKFKVIDFDILHGSLTLFHTIQNFNDPDKESFRKHCGKRRKRW